MTLKFMGQEFATLDALQRTFPAYAGVDAVRAIRAGATTPMEVETASWRDRNRVLLKKRAAQQRNAIKGKLVKPEMRRGRGSKAA